MKHLHIHLAFLAKSILIAAGVLGGQITANAAVLEEVIVTAQKREQNLQDVPISVTAFSGAQTEALGLNTTQELVGQVPALQVQSYTPSFTSFNLRGISQNNFKDHLEAPVAVYVDDVYLGSMNAINMQMFDMARTEVLRGPQGTLFGRNATGGLLHFRSRKATEDELNGYIRASYGEHDDRIIEGAVGGAFSDTVRGRFAGRMQKADGYIKPGTVAAGVLGPGDPGFTASGNDANESDGYVIRANLQIDLTENTLLDLQLQHTEDDDVGTGQYVVKFVAADPATLFGLEPGAPITGDVHRHASNSTAELYNRESTIYTGKLTHGFSNGVEMNYVGAYVDLDKTYHEDAAGGLFFFPYSTQADYEQWSHELRFSGSTDRMRWLAGGYLLDVDFEGLDVVGGPVIVGDPTGEITTNPIIESENWSVFGEVEYDFTDALTMIAGFRWSQDDKNIAFRATANNFTAPGTPDGTTVFELTSAIAASTNPAHDSVPTIDYGDWAGRLQFSYQTENNLIYGAINRGIKGGNWSPSSDVSLDNFQHSEEVLLAYELGIKSTIFDGKGRVNAAIYYYDYDDYQVFSLVGAVPQVANSDASSYGGEIEFAYYPTENWDLNVGLAYIDSEVDFVEGVIPGSGNSNVEYPQAPRVSLNGLIRYNTDIAGGNLALQVDGYWNDDQFIEGSNSLASLQTSYGVVNARATYARDSWSASVWVKNLADEEYLLYNLDIAFAGIIEQVYGPPRQVGVTVKYNF